MNFNWETSKKDHMVELGTDDSSLFRSDYVHMGEYCNICLFHLYFSS